MVIEVKKEEKVEPKFRDPETMTKEELTDPDYRSKQLMKDGGTPPMVCSKCHHCR